MPYSLEALPERLAKHITVEDRGCLFGPCWCWGARKNRNGYGRVSWNGKQPVAHRVVWSMLVGPIPDGLLLDHLCRVRSCVNPDHLEPVSHSINTRRGEAVLFTVP